LFCKPRPKNHTLRRATRETHPAEWAEFLELQPPGHRRDARDHRALPEWNYRGAELALWHLDQRINDRGFAVDLDLARAAIAATDIEKARLKAEMREATDGLVSGPSKRDDLLAFILAEYGVDLPDMKADTLRRRLEDPELPDGVKLLINIRLEATKTSTAKYQALVKATSRRRPPAQHAAVRRRAAHRALGRPHLPAAEHAAPHRGLRRASCRSWRSRAEGRLRDVVDGDVMQLTSNCIRGAIVAAPGKKLVRRRPVEHRGPQAGLARRRGWKLRRSATSTRHAGTTSTTWPTAQRSTSTRPTSARTSARSARSWSWASATRAASPRS
jgi:DNA polymerase